MAKYLISCPFCGSHIELAGNETEDLFNIVNCPNCGRTFDYDPQELRPISDEENNQ